MLVTELLASDPGVRRFQLTQRRFLASDAAAGSSNVWAIPITVMTGSHPETQKMVFDQAEAVMDVQAAPDTWVKFNAGQSGFYRVAYAPALRTSLWADLATLPPMERLGVWSDAFALAKADLMPMIEVLGWM